jgi:hypothetical protein
MLCANRVTIEEAPGAAIWPGRYQGRGLFREAWTTANPYAILWTSITTTGNPQTSNTGNKGRAWKTGGQVVAKQPPVTPKAKKKGLHFHVNP